jgi:acetyl-CoA carboxylase biotin carboxyl carrier protein
VQTKKTVAVKKRSSTKKVTAKKVPSKVKIPPEFTMKQVKEIVALIKDAGSFTTFGYKTDEFEIEISVGSPQPILAKPAPIPQVIPNLPVSGVTQASPTQTVFSASEHVIKSPMIGTFYRRPSPNSAPFVEIGDSVTPNTDVCIVEVMKLLNTIPAECHGRVVRILVEDGETITAGQALMVIEVN